MSLESIRQGQIQYHDGDLPSSHSRSRPTPLYIDPSKAYAWATKQAEQNEHLQLFFDRYCEKFGGTCLTVTYERLSSKNAVWAFAELRLAIFGESVACAPGAAPPAWVPCSERVSNWPGSSQALQRHALARSVLKTQSPRGRASRRRGTRARARGGRGQRRARRRRRGPARVWRRCATSRRAPSSTPRGRAPTCRGTRWRWACGAEDSAPRRWCSARAPPPRTPPRARAALARWRRRRARRGGGGGARARTRGARRAGLDAGGSDNREGEAPRQWIKARRRSVRSGRATAKRWSTSLGDLERKARDAVRTRRPPCRAPRRRARAPRAPTPRAPLPPTPGTAAPGVHA